jgi:hypothetical protein
MQGADGEDRRDWALVGLLLTRAAAAPPTFRTKVDLVQVDVIVQDKKRQSRSRTDAGGLRAVRSRQAQTLPRSRKWRAMSSARGPAPLQSFRRDVAMNVGPQAERWFVMVLDDCTSTRSAPIAPARLRATCIAQFGPQSSMAVLFTSGDHSHQVTQESVRCWPSAVETLKGRAVVAPAASRQRPDARRAHRDPEDSARSALSKLQARRTHRPGFQDNMRQYKTLRTRRGCIATAAVTCERKPVVRRLGRHRQDLSGHLSA